MTDPVLVLHTTEGTTMAGARATLNTNRSWSHWLCDPATGDFEQLVDPDRPARSLRNLSGGVETNNRGGVYQIEIVGRAARVPTYPVAWYQQLAAWIVDLCNRHGIPRRFPYRFDGVDAYGHTGSVRLTGSQWLAVSGIIGHQHVPENTHWDPGDISRLIPLVTEGAPAPMSITLPASRDATIKRIQTALGVAVDGDPYVATAAAAEALAARARELEAQVATADPAMAALGRRFVALVEEANDA